MPSKGSRILVTGAAGFIGSRVCNRLLTKGFQVLGIDSLNDAYDVRLKEWRLRQLGDNGRFHFEILDICSKDALSELLRRLPCSAVVNLAARAGVRQSVVTPEEYYRTNLSGTLILLELCRDFQISKFVQASSSSVYGEQAEQPLREDMPVNQPLSPYAASKQASETLCYSYHRLHGLDITVFRYFTVYGPAGRPDMSPFRFVKWILEGTPVTVYGSGMQSRDFTFVEDIAEGTVLGLRPLGYEIVNLGSDRPIALMETLQTYEGLIGKKATTRFLPKHPADVQATWADIRKAEKLLGWRPRTAFEQGARQLVQWYLRNVDWLSQIAVDG